MTLFVATTCPLAIATGDTAFDSFAVQYRVGVVVAMFGFVGGASFSLAAAICAPGVRA